MGKGKDKMEYLIGIDLGTSGAKIVLFSSRGKTVCSAMRSYSLYQPKNGWAEQAPEDWWNAVADGLSDVLSQSGVDASLIRGIGLSGQMHGLVLLDHLGCPLRRAIIWCDQRSQEECVQLEETLGQDRLLEITGNPALPGFTASKILWVQNHEPHLWEKCAHILLPKDYIRYQLTGELATDVSDASGMQLMELRKRAWSAEVLNVLQIEKGMLASMHESQELTGAVCKKAAARTGLKEGTPVVAGAGDNAAAAVGVGIVKPGQAFNTIGTSGVIYALMDDCSCDSKGRIHTLCASVPGKWTAMSCTQAAGLSLQWLRNTCCKDVLETAAEHEMDSYAYMDKMAEAVPPGAQNLIFLPYLMGERSPHPDPYCRGTFLGLAAFHTQAHLIRAVMEGVAYSQWECLDVFRELGVQVDSMAICGGGARSKLWRQMLCDMYGCPVYRTQAEEGPALGAALLAAVGVGLYSSLEEACGNVVAPAEVCHPDEKAHLAYEPYYKLYKNLYQSLKKDFFQLAKL